MANILVCDDDKEIVDAIEIYLKQEGDKIYKAYNGAFVMVCSRLASQIPPQFLVRPTCKPSFPDCLPDTHILITQFFNNCLTIIHTNTDNSAVNYYLSATIILEESFQSPPNHSFQ